MDDFAARSQYRISDLLVVPDRLVIVPDGQDVPLQPRMMAVLILLTEEAGKVLSSERLLVTVRSTDVYGNNPVQKAISGLRKSIGDTPRNPRYIETVPRLGDRLIALVWYPESRPRV